MFVCFPDISLFVLVLSFLMLPKGCLCTGPHTSLSAAGSMRRPSSFQYLVLLCPCLPHSKPLDGEGPVLPAPIRRIHWTPDNVLSKVSPAWQQSSEQCWVPHCVNKNGFLPSSVPHFDIWSPRQLSYAARITKSLLKCYQLLGSPLAWKGVLK